MIVLVILSHKCYKTGGALSLAVQESVNQYCVNNGLPVRRVRFMEVLYLSPCKGRVLINVSPISHLKARNRSDPMGSIRYATKDGAVDSFRVVIRANNDKVRSKDSKIYVQASIILY